MNVDSCPGCGASTATAKVLGDNLDIMLATDLEQQRTEIAKKGAFSA